MDKKLLLDSAIQEGKELIEILDLKGISIKVAFWLYTSSDNSWMLLLASSHGSFNIARRLLPAYQIIVDCLKEIRAKTLTGAEIQIIGLDDRLVKALARCFKIENGAIRLQGTVVDRFYLEDAYIYRLDLPEKKVRVPSKNPCSRGRRRSSNLSKNR